MAICDHIDCTKQSVFNYTGQINGKYCADHKIEGMIIYPKSFCKIKNCREIALYASTNKRADHCETHKLPNEINIIEKNCKKCNLPNIVNLNGECTYCDPLHFNQFRLGKQLQIKNWLDQSTDFKYISYDSAINYKSCGDKERPDFVFTTNSHYVVLEVDENQHTDHNEQCECTRMVNISQSLGMPTLFIRYNPDQYRVNKVKHNPSFSSRTKLLHLVVKSSIDLHIEQLPGYCGIKHLYFNEFNVSMLTWQAISQFVDL